MALMGHIAAGQSKPWHYQLGCDVLLASDCHWNAAASQSIFGKFNGSTPLAATCKLDVAVSGQYDMQAGASQPLDDVVQYLVEADADAKQDVQTSASVFKPGWEVNCLPTCSHNVVCCACKCTALQLPHAVKACKACSQANWYQPV